MSPGDYGKYTFKFQEVFITPFINLSDHIVSIDVEGHDEHRNMHGCVSL